MNTPQNQTQYTSEDTLSQQDENVSSAYRLQPHSHISGGSEWVPPSKYGLDNSEPIIHNYFCQKILSAQINYLDIIKDDIRNSRPLTARQLEFIQRLDRDEMYNIVVELNRVLSDAVYILETQH